MSDPSTEADNSRWCELRNRSRHRLPLNCHSAAHKRLIASDKSAWQWPVSMQNLLPPALGCKPGSSKVCKETCQLIWSNYQSYNTDNKTRPAKWYIRCYLVILLHWFIDQWLKWPHKAAVSLSPDGWFNSIPYFWAKLSSRHHHVIDGQSGTERAWSYEANRTLTVKQKEMQFFLLSLNCSTAIRYLYRIYLFLD